MRMMVATPTRNLSSDTIDGSDMVKDKLFEGQRREPSPFKQPTQGGSPLVVLKGPVPRCAPRT